MAREFPIVHLDDKIVVIDKPSGFHVHPPETNSHKVPREKIILHQLRDQLGQHLYPVHRLDAGTSGLLMFALSSLVAKEINQQFTEQQVRKTYWAFVRGRMDSEGVIDIPLKSDSTEQVLEAKTHFTTLQTIELPVVMGDYSTCKYSWIEARPQSGRYHQIRRHLNRVSHPIIGDAQHGDSRHNQVFREKYGISGLCLRAIELELPEWGLKWNCGLNLQWTLLQNIFDGKH